MGEVIYAAALNVQNCVPPRECELMRLLLLIYANFRTHGQTRRCYTSFSRFAGPIWATLRRCAGRCGWRHMMTRFFGAALLRLLPQPWRCRPLQHFLGITLHISRAPLLLMKRRRPAFFSRPPLPPRRILPTDLIFGRADERAGPPRRRPTPHRLWPRLTHRHNIFASFAEKLPHFNFHRLSRLHSALAIFHYLHITRRSLCRVTRIGA